MKNVAQKIKLAIAALVALLLAAITQGVAAGEHARFVPDLALGENMAAMVDNLRFGRGEINREEGGASVEPLLSDGEAFWVTNEHDKSPDLYELEFYGYVKAIADGFWVVDEFQIRITPRTEIIGQIKIGAWVRVTAVFGEDDRLIAKRIELASDLRHRNGITFYGIVESISDPSWFIIEHEVFVTSETEIAGPIGVGDYVKVRAIFGGTDRFIAVSISRAEPPGGDQQDKNSGDTDGTMINQDRVTDSGQDRNQDRMDTPTDTGSDGPTDGNTDAGSDGGDVIVHHD